MFRLKLVPEKTNIPFTRFRLPAMIASGVFLAASVGLLFVIGLNFGIDFRGGISLDVVDDEPIDIAEVRSTVDALGLGSSKVQGYTFGEGEARRQGVSIYLSQQEVSAEDVPPPAEDAVTSALDVDVLAEQAQQSAANQVQDALRNLLGEGFEALSIEVVGPTVSGELIQKGAMAVVIAIVLMLIYIYFRFQWQFAIGAVVALVHDVILTLGVFAITGIEFNLSIIAAILTIIGYSMNDTVIVYDRVRENLRRYKKKPLPELIDVSINETLSRTVMTSGTTLLALIALYVLGGPVLRGFTFAMIWGIVVGTYSSVYIASPFLLLTGVKRDWSSDGAAAAKA